MTTLSIRNVTKTYAGGITVIHGIYLDVGDGELIVIGGPSGCGKSILIRMVAGLKTITGGETLIDDKVFNQLEPGERDIAMMFQNYALYSHMSVFENPEDPQVLERRDQTPRLRRRHHSGTGPSYVNPRCSCSTSRCPTWTPSCA